MSREYIFLCGDGGTRCVKSMTVLEKFDLINVMIADDDDVGEKVEVPLPHVSSKIFGMLVEYTEQRMNGRVLAQPKRKMQENWRALACMVDNEWLREFAAPLMQPTESGKLDKRHPNPYMLADFILASNYLGNELALEFGCMLQATLIYNKTAAQVRELYDIPTPTADDEKALRQANKWVFDVKPIGVQDEEEAEKLRKLAAAAPVRLADPANVAQNRAPLRVDSDSDSEDEQ